MPAGVSMMRFSTEPSSETSTASAFSGSRRTNSICLSRTLSLVVSTTPAPRVKSDKRLVVSVRAPSKPRPSAAALTSLSIRARSALVRSPNSSSASTKKRRPSSVGNRPGAGVRRVDQAQLFEILHHVAHGGRRKRDRQQAGEMTRPDGLAGRPDRNRRCAGICRANAHPDSPRRSARPESCQRVRPWRHHADKAAPAQAASPWPPPIQRPA